MIKLARKSIIPAIILCIAIWVVLINSGSITIHLPFPHGKTITGNAGAILIGSFTLGVISAALVALFLGIKTYFRERRLHSKEKQRQAFYDTMLMARGFLASGEWTKAKEEWEKVIKKDPTDIIARVELSRSLEGTGELREALKILDGARTADPQNIEVLFRAAELNLALNNKTAAIDNLALILYNQPNKKAAIMARKLSEELERIEDALEYQKQLERFTSTQENSRDITTRLEFKKILRDSTDNEEELCEKLKTFLKKNPSCVAALHKLSTLETKKGNIDAAAQHLVKAAKASGASIFWLEASKLWIKNSKPERALAAARAASKDASNSSRIDAQLSLIKLYITLNMLEDAKKGLDNLPNLLKSLGLELSSSQSHTLLVLEGLCLNLMGEYRESAEIWKKLCDFDFEAKELSIEKQIGLNGDTSLPSLL